MVPEVEAPLLRPTHPNCDQVHLPGRSCILPGRGLGWFGRVHRRQSSATPNTIRRVDLQQSQRAGTLPKPGAARALRGRLLPQRRGTGCGSCHERRAASAWMGMRGFGGSGSRLRLCNSSVGCSRAYHETGWGSVVAQHAEGTGAAGKEVRARRRASRVVSCACSG